MKKMRNIWAGIADGRPMSIDIWDDGLYYWDFTSNQPEFFDKTPSVTNVMSIVHVLNDGTYSGIDDVEFCKELLG